MRNVLMTLVAVALLAAPSIAAMDIRVTVYPPVVGVGVPATVTIEAKAPASVGVASVAGDVQAGAYGAATLGGLTANGDLAFADDWNRLSETNFPSVPGGNGTNGGWTGFGTMQQNGGDLPTSVGVQWGTDTWVTIATYTVTPDTEGYVALTFVPQLVSGFKCDLTDDDQTTNVLPPAFPQFGADVGDATAVIRVSNCYGDVDGSGAVDGTDLLYFQYAWLQGPGDGQWWWPVDMDGSRFVDGTDLIYFQYGWLGTCAQTPELQVLQ
jgi:hypothetical protein